MNDSRLNGRRAVPIIGAVCVAIVLLPVVAWAAAPASRTTTIKGTVKVSNFPATQTVSGSVSVSNLPSTQHVDGTVNVGNLPATQSVQGTVTAVPGLPETPYTAFSSSGTSPSISVPAGHHLVVQSVSVFTEITSGDKIDDYLEYTTGGVSGYLFIPLTLQYASGGEDYYYGNVQADIYADGGSSITAVNLAVAGGSIAGGGLDVSGFETN
jgi:hypothetical protein